MRSFISMTIPNCWETMASFGHIICETRQGCLTRVMGVKTDEEERGKSGEERTLEQVNNQRKR